MNWIKNIHRYQNLNLAIIIIRLWLGTVMIKHSTNYLFGGKMDGFISYLTNLGFALPQLMAYTSQIAELVTAVMILLGLRIGAIILAFNMLVAVLFAHKLLIYSEGELAFNYFLFAFILSVTGCGKLALDQLIFKNSISY